MQEMVKIFQYKIGDEEINSVNARELHKILESKQQFTDWIKRRLKDTQALENFENFCKEIKRLTTEISNLREKIQILEDLVASSDRLISMYKKQLEAKTIDEDIRRLVRRKEQLKQEGYL